MAWVPLGPLPSGPGTGGASTVDQLTDIGDVGAVIAKADTQAAVLSASGAAAASDLATLAATVGGKASDGAVMHKTGAVAESVDGVKTFTSSPIVPTPTAGDSSTKAATTAFVAAAINLLTTGTPGLLDTLAEIDAAIANDPNFATTMTTALGQKVDKATAIAGLAIATGISAVNLANQLAASTTQKGTLEIATATEVNDWAAPSSSLAVTPAMLPVRFWVYNYGTSSWPALPATAPAGLGLILACGPAEPAAGLMPTWAGIGDGKVRVQFVLDPAAP